MKNDPILELKVDVIQPFRIAAFGVAIFLLFALVWATTAQLSTTVHVSGKLVSSSPQYELQHAYGGKIEHVLVAQHDQLDKGQAVFELNVTLQKHSLVQISTLISQLADENQILDQLLTQNLTFTQNSSETKNQTYYKDKITQHEANLLNIRKSTQSLAEQVTVREASLKLLNDRRFITKERLNHIVSLAAKGAATNAQAEEHTDRLMNLSSQINEARGDLTGLRDQLRQTQLKANQYKVELRLELQKRRLANDQRLPDLRRQSLGLNDEIENAIIRSPISGSVMELNYATNQMQVPKGATLAVISRPLEQPMVHITIPTQVIDQVSTGMKGVLTLSSLPQRNLSRVTAEVVAISPDVFTDASGIPVGYKAIAEINTPELQTALDGLKINMHLASGMPAALALEGRQVTFSQYLVAPFFKIFKGALQD
jgi:HlyD family type I secretion membrane fusion protein